MRFEIDVSGCDIFKQKYAICIASKDLMDGKKLIKGFRISREIMEELQKKWKANHYRYYYDQYERTRGTFKVRVYCAIVYYLLKSLDLKEKISLTICRDFSGRESTITQNLRFFLEDIGGMEMGTPQYQKLPDSSLAHWYARNTANDSENRLDTYVEISLRDIEKFLYKRKKKLHQ